jgi:hypothetical protein
MSAAHNTRRRRKPPVADPLAAIPMFPEPTTQNLIKWPTDKQIKGVSKQLAQIGQIGVRSEASGDYFNSGDLAYQMQEITRATAELFQRGRRIRH